MKIVKEILLPLATLCIFSSHAIAQSNTPSSNKGPVIPVREIILHSDRKMVAAGGLPPSVLKIDEELLTIPLDSPKAIPLEKQKQAAMNTFSAAVSERLKRVQAESPLYPPVRGSSRPQGQEQRMCSVNNGSATYLVPC